MNVRKPKITNFSKNITAWRKEKKLNQSDVAKYLGITQSNYSLLESGKTRLAVEIAIKICGFFNKPLIELMYDDGLDIDTTNLKLYKMQELASFIRLAKVEIDYLKQINRTLAERLESFSKLEIDLRMHFNKLKQ